MFMADIKDDQTHQQALIVDQEPQGHGDESQPPQKEGTQKRVDSLDIFRGLTVALMILVDDAGGEWPMINHAPWNGCNLADFVMPFFLFIVGMAIPLALKRIPDPLMAVRKVIFRTLKLLFWGILLQGGYSHAPDELSYGVDMRRIRWCGILQRIALAYLVVALLEIATKISQAKNRSIGQFSIFRLYCWQWVVGACVLIIYLSVLYGTYVPDWQFTAPNPESPDFGKHFIVKCGVRGKLSPPCNAVGYVDRKVLGINHLYHHPAWRRSKACTAKSPYEGPLMENAPPWCHAPFEPEGILSSISAILSTIFGVHFGHVLVHIKNHADRLKHWVSLGFALLTLGLLLHFTNAIPLNKQLYTFSYVCVTSGAAALVFSSFYALIHWIQKHLFIGVWHSKRVGMLLYVIFAEILFWAVVAGILHRLKIYWKL